MEGLYIALALFGFAGLIFFGRWLHNNEERWEADDEAQKQRDIRDAEAFKKQLVERL